MKQYKHRIKDCKEEYNECMRRCLDRVRRIVNDDFPLTIDTLGGYL